MLRASLVRQEEKTMEMSQVHNIAKRLVNAHGAKAELEAAERLQHAEIVRDDVKIELWRRVRSAVLEMKPTNES